MTNEFLNDELQERKRHLRSQINYYETMASVNSKQGNGEEWSFCVDQRTKLVMKLNNLTEQY